MINSYLIKRVEDKVIDTLLLAERIYKRSFELPSLSFDINSGRTAGLAYYGDWKIKINSKFLETNPDEVINQTTPHEVAHLLNHVLFPRAKQHHGPEWKSVMRNLGLPPSRCHNMQDTESFPHTYICACQKHFVSNLIHRKMEHGQRRFCKKCKSQVVYLGTK